MGFFNPANFYPDPISTRRAQIPKKVKFAAGVADPLGLA
jgi:hypothetical protein